MSARQMIEFYSRTQMLIASDDCCQGFSLLYICGVLSQLSDETKCLLTIIYKTQLDLQSKVGEYDTTDFKDFLPAVIYQ